MLDAENDKALTGFAPMNPSVYSCLSGVGLDFTSADVRRQDLGRSGAPSAEGHEAHKAMACGTLALRGGALAAVGLTARLSREHAPCARTQ